ncbi:MAG: serine/threonine protein kinase [Deltaproteobacteria bacterium]|nr:serine/threonine protein kinase [Deltaproteobacteria bacterium]MBW2074590.1 serine/threonine protein kinase [Deltaproteobacteria bacterium]
MSTTQGLGDEPPETNAASSVRKKPDGAKKVNIGEWIDGRYIIEERIGAGGFGTVWKAVESKREEFVAVKEVRHKWLNSPKMLNYFKNEFKVLERLSHESTVCPIDLVRGNGTYLIIMEYLCGGSLSQRLRHSEPLEISTALLITVRMLDVLKACSRLKIIHRDIKPSNILFADKSFEQPKLGDFGLACFKSELLALSPRAIGSEIAGTLTYMSPEQLNGKKLSVKTDIYSLGMTLYKMLTGRLFFDPELLSRAGIKRAILRPFREHPGRYRPDLPYWLDELVMNMISVEPRKRPGDPQAVLDVIERNS